jgi:uncharacterized protein
MDGGWRKPLEFNGRDWKYCHNPTENPDHFKEFAFENTLAGSFRRMPGKPWGWHGASLPGFRPFCPTFEAENPCFWPWISRCRAPAFGRMPDLVQVKPLALLPTQAGCAVFLGDGHKAIVFYIDPAIGASIQATIQGGNPPRPLTHDLYKLTLDAFGAKVLRMIIVSMKDEIYHARLILEARNEIMECKLVELDCRPSDGLAMALRFQAPIYVLRELWERLEDMSDVLRSAQEEDDQS